MDFKPNWNLFSHYPLISADVAWVHLAVGDNLYIGAMRLKSF